MKKLLLILLIFAVPSIKAQKELEAPIRDIKNISRVGLGMLFAAIGSANILRGISHYFPSCKRAFQPMCYIAQPQVRVPAYIDGGIGTGLLYAGYRLIKSGWNDIKRLHPSVRKIEDNLWDYINWNNESNYE